MMNSKRNLKRGKSGDLLLNSFLGIVCTVLFFGLIAYSYRIFFTGQSAALSPEFISEMNKLYTDQRVKITDFSTSSSSFINAYSACKFKPSVQVPLSMQFEVQRLKSVQEDFISNFDETSRKLIVSAFKPFVGVGLEEKGIVKDGY